MKTSFSGILLPLCILFSISTTAQEKANKALHPQIDERVELVSIVFRLAGSEEYNSEQFKMYTNDIHQHFDPFKEHPLIVFTKQLIKENHVGYDAVMSIAIALNQPPLLTPLVPFTNEVVDARWGKDNANKFALLLQQFYKDAGCHAFFKDHRKMYALLINRFTKTSQVNVQWIENFYGKYPDNQFNIIIAAGNGAGNYGEKIRISGKTEQVYAIIGTWKMDSTGLPIYPKEDILPTIVHEFNHSFANKLVEVNVKQFERSGPLIFKEEEQLMRMQAYSEWKTMIMEGLVRASVVSYLKANETDDLLPQLQLGEEECRGFIWTSDLVRLLDYYEKNRARYETLESFMPEIMKFFDAVPDHIVELKKSFSNKCPKIISIFPIENNANNVDDTLRELKIVFDKDMMGEYTDYKSMGLLDCPIIDKLKFDTDKHTLLTKIKIEPKSEYGFILPAMKFRSQSGYGFAADYPIYFATKGFEIKPNQVHFGYLIDSAKVTFIFEIPAALKLSEDVKKISVAGNFNDWNPETEGFELRYVKKNLYQLTIEKDKLGKSGEKKEFKFVVNGHIWVPVSRRALNKVLHEDGSENLIIQL